MQLLYSRKNDSFRSFDQSFGVGATAKNVLPVLSSGPGESQYAIATPRLNSGIAITSSGLSGMVTTLWDLTKSVASPTTSFAYPTTVASSGCLSASLSSTAAVTLCLSASVAESALGKYFL